MTSPQHRFSPTLLRSFIIFLVYFACCPKVDAKIDDAYNLRLELAQVIFRHGNRTPDFPYYNDPNANETFYPHGWNALDTGGRQLAYRLGEYLKSRYGDFVPDYHPAKVKIWSTPLVRTIMSAQLVAAGLFPPKYLKWDVPGSLGHIWQPVAIDSTQNSLYYESGCHAYFQEVHKVSTGPPMQAVLDSDPELYQAYVENAFPPNTTITYQLVYEFLFLFTAITIESNWNMTTPEWAKPFFPDRMRAFAEQIYSLIVYTDKMKRTVVGPLLDHLITQMDLKEQGSALKMWLYSGHDISVANLGILFGFWEGIYIDFSSAMLMELYSNSNGRYFVKVLMVNDTSKAAVPLTVAGCREICPLNQFRRLFERFIPEDVRAECLNVERKNTGSVYSRFAPILYLTLSSFLVIIK